MTQAGAKRLKNIPHPVIKPTGHNWSGREIFNSQMQVKIGSRLKGHLSFSFRPPAAFAGSRENAQSRSVMLQLLSKVQLCGAVKTLRP